MTDWGQDSRLAAPEHGWWRRRGERAKKNMSKKAGETYEINPDFGFVFFLRMVFINFRLRVKDFTAFYLRFDSSMPRSNWGFILRQIKWNYKYFQRCHVFTIVFFKSEVWVR